MSVLTRFLPALPPPPSLVMARGDVFFVRRVAIAPGEPTAAQVSLALEGMAPFPPEQLYVGHVLAADGLSALVFAAFRRRFTADEVAVWDGARVVTPEFLPLLAAREGEAPQVILHEADGRATALIWGPGESLPSTVVVREADAASADAVFASAFERSGLTPDFAAVRRLEGATGLAETGAGGFAATAGGAALGTLPATWSETCDVRDPDFLAERRRAAKRDLWLWRGLLGAAALLALALALDIGASVVGAVANRREARVRAQTDAVRSIETAQTLANRIAELSEKRLMPFEMLNLINPARPESVVFQRVVTRGLLKMEIEAQAGNAEDVGKYANALKAAAGVASAGARDIRARDGVTTFMLDVEFKADALRNGGGQ